MVLTPCYYMVWEGLPVIRKELAKSMVKNYGFCQKEAAIMIGITPAAVCQYLSNKRSKINIVDKKILTEINKSVEIIIKNGKSVVNTETCRICHIIRKKGILSFSAIKNK